MSLAEQPLSLGLPFCYFQLNKHRNSTPARKVARWALFWNPRTQIGSWVMKTRGRRMSISGTRIAETLPFAVALWGWSQAHLNQEDEPSCDLALLHVYWLARKHQTPFSKLPHVSWDPSGLHFIPQQWTFLFRGAVIWDRFVSICQGMQMLLLLLLLQFTMQINKQLSKQKLRDVDSNIRLQT